MAGAGRAPSQSLILEGIGASQAAAAVGLDPWQPPIALFERLLGLLPPSKEENERMRWGKLLEHPIRQAYVEETGLAVYVPPKSLFHPEHSWRRATPDGLILHEPLLAREEIEPSYPLHWRHGLEIKTADHYARDEWGEPGTDEIPPRYICQVTWSMHVTGLDRWDVAVLIGGSDFRVYSLHRDHELESNLVSAVCGFWHGNVEASVPPPVDHTRDFRRYLERRWPGAREDYAQADTDTERLLERILDRRAALATLKRDDARDCNELCDAIAGAAGLETTLGRVHWKPSRARQLVDWRSVAHSLSEQLQVSAPAFSALVEANTRQGKAGRPLRLPRIAGATDDEES